MIPSTAADGSALIAVIEFTLLWASGVSRTAYWKPHISEINSPPKQQLPWLNTFQVRGSVSAKSARAWKQLL